MKEWYYSTDNQTHTLCPEDQLKDMLINGVLPPETLIWTGNPEQGGKGWQYAKDTEFAPYNHILGSSILYIIARSSTDKFSLGKMEQYLLLLNLQHPIGVTLNRDRYGSIFIVQLRECIQYLKNRGLIEDIGVTRKTKKRAARHVFVLCEGAPTSGLPSHIRDFLDELIARYDDATSNTVAAVYEERIQNLQKPVI